MSYEESAQKALDGAEYRIKDVNPKVRDLMWVVLKMVEAVVFALLSISTGGR